LDCHLTINSTFCLSASDFSTLPVFSERTSIRQMTAKWTVTLSDHCPIQYQSVTLLVIIHRSCYNNVTHCGVRRCYPATIRSKVYDGRLLFALVTCYWSRTAWNRRRMGLGCDTVSCKTSNGSFCPRDKRVKRAFEPWEKFCRFSMSRQWRRRRYYDPTKEQWDVVSQHCIDSFFPQLFALLLFHCSRSKTSSCFIGATSNVIRIGLFWRRCDLNRENTFREIFVILIEETVSLRKLL
jgi:hypothetical protein